MSKLCGSCALVPTMFSVVISDDQAAMLGGDFKINEPG